MTILVTGSTGTVGSMVVQRLAEQKVSVHALARHPEKASVPSGVKVVKGDMTDVDSMRQALHGIDTLFLLNAVTPDEITQALLTMSLAREAGIRRYVYLSVFNAERFTDAPHFASKHAVERMIEEANLPATILRPAYFMQNDLSLKAPVLDAGVYPMPLGDTGVSMVDVRDIADVAALSSLKHDRATESLPREVIHLVGPQALTGQAVANIWSQVRGSAVHYAGDDLNALESQFKSFAPGWMARDMRIMFDRIQQDGMVGTSDHVARLTTLLGRPPRSYRDFATEAMRAWQAS